MNKAIVVAAALVAASGCKKDSKPAGDCKADVTAAFHRAAHAGIVAGATKDGKTLDDKMRGEMALVEKDLEARFQPVSDAIAGVCVSDHWSADMLTCVRQANDGPAIDACNKFLDDAQRKHLDAVTEAAQAKTDAPAGKSPICDKYADLEIKCNAAGEDARPTILDFCMKARNGAKEVTYQLIALESSCAETVTDCDSYKACVEKKKSETSPQ
jgi:hypothetical protein